MSRRGTAGFTLLEVIVCLGIVCMLMGMGYASLGGAREKARQAKCMSNLRQIGIALAMYRQDYHGREVGRPEQMGLPPTPFALLAVRPSGEGPYLADADVFHCPNAPVGGKRRAQGARWTLYGYNVWGRAGWLPPGFPSFANATRERAGDLPIFFCRDHMDYGDPPPGHPRYVIVLRLDGRVDGRWVGSGGSWKY